MLRLRACVTRVVMLLITVMVLTLPRFTGVPQAQTLQPITWASEPTAAKGDLAKIRRLLVVADVDISIASQFCEDAIAVELMAAKISVVSRGERDREQLLKLVELGEDAEKATKRSRDKRADLLAVGEATKADALVVVTLVATTAQLNVYASDPLRITEVRNELAVRASSITVVEVSTGRLLLAGVMASPNGTPLTQAARDIGQGLVKQLR